MDAGCTHVDREYLRWSDLGEYWGHVVARFCMKTLIKSPALHRYYGYRNNHVSLSF